MAAGVIGVSLFDAVGDKACKWCHKKSFWVVKARRERGSSASSFNQSVLRLSCAGSSLSWKNVLKFLQLNQFHQSNTDLYQFRFWTEISRFPLQLWGLPEIWLLTLIFEIADTFLSKVTLNQRQIIQLYAVFIYTFGHRKRSGCTRSWLD